MSDLFLTVNGDIVVNGSRDIALTNSSFQNDVQQVYIRLMTEPGDFYVYPTLGVNLDILYGMPQTPQTGEVGKRLIKSALDREGIFKGKNISINAVPTSRDSIRFDVHVVNNNNQPVTLSVNQNLGA